MKRSTHDTVSNDALRAVREQLRALARATPPATNVAAFAEACWASIDVADWPSLFRLLDIAADLPRLADNQTLAHLPEAQWPALAQVADDVLALQALVDHPLVPPGSLDVATMRDATAAKARLDAHHCATVDFFLDAAQRQQLDAAIDTFRPAKDGTWGPLTQDEAPDVHALMQTGVASPAFRHMTGFDPDRDAFSLTLSLQQLAPAGIGWHRDLYWPVEWVGQDVFAVFYALGSDTPDKGGAFVYYLPWNNTIHHFYRQRHQATVLWNSADPEGRILHAVSNYHGPDTERHLLILQCLRRAAPVDQ